MAAWKQPARIGRAALAGARTLARTLRAAVTGRRPPPEPKQAATADTSDEPLLKLGPGGDYLRCIYPADLWHRPPKEVRS